METIFFGGTVGPNTPVRPDPYTKETDLDAFDKAEFKAVFGEWLMQCWMEDAHVPNTAEELADFNLDDLIPKFRKEFKAGSWKRMKAGRGATAEQFILYLQLVNRKPCILLVNQELPWVKSDTIRQKAMSGFHIVGILSMYMIKAKENNQLDAGASPVMLYDGQIGHVITARTLSDDKDWISYDDPTWPGAKSMLCEGENAAGVKAFYLGQPEVGNWIVDVISLSRLVFGLPILQDELPTINRWKTHLDKQYRNARQRLFG